MSNNHTHNRHLLLTIVIKLIFFLFTLNCQAEPTLSKPQEIKINNTAKVISPLLTQPNDSVHVIVEDTPLAIPEEFKRTLQSLGVTSLTLGNGQKQVRLVTIDGRYINPCYTEKNSGNPSHSCQFEAGLGETHEYINDNLSTTNPTNGSHHILSFTMPVGCGICQGGGISRVCKKTNRKYGCSSQASICDTGCN